MVFDGRTHILWKYTRHFGYPADNARQDVADLQALHLHTVSTADSVLARKLSDSDIDVRSPAEVA